MSYRSFGRLKDLVSLNDVGMIQSFQDAFFMRQELFNVNSGAFTYVSDFYGDHFLHLGWVCFHNFTEHALSQSALILVTTTLHEAFVHGGCGCRVSCDAGLVFTELPLWHHFLEHLILRTFQSHDRGTKSRNNKLNYNRLCLSIGGSVWPWGGFDVMPTDGKTFFYSSN